MVYEIIQGKCEEELFKEKLEKISFFKSINLTFLDPPFNQDKDYASHDDNMDPAVYWTWMTDVCRKIYDLTSDGGAIYFMQREKNAEFVLKALRESGWELQNLIIWEKLTSAVPIRYGFGKRYQIIAFASKGRPRLFNRLRYEPPLLAIHEYQRPDGILVTDIWDDIKELTSGFFAGDEAIRTENGEFFTDKGDRFHKQQSPIALLLRIILSSSQKGDLILDPFAGTGVTGVVAEQLSRNSILIEVDPKNCQLLKERLASIRPADRIMRFYSDYLFTKSADSNDEKYNEPIKEIKKKIKDIQGKLKEKPKNKEDLENELMILKKRKDELEDIRIIKDIWDTEVEINEEIITGLVREPKFNPSLSYLMRESIIIILNDLLNISKDYITQDFKVLNNKMVHRWDFLIGEKKRGLLIKLIYARDVKEARFWSEQIPKEVKLVNKKYPEYELIYVLSGMAFSGFIKGLQEGTQNNQYFITSFSGWQDKLNLMCFNDKIKEMLTFIEELKNKTPEPKKIKPKPSKKKIKSSLDKFL